MPFSPLKITEILCICFMHFIWSTILGYYEPFPLRQTISSYLFLMVATAQAWYLIPKTTRMDKIFRKLCKFFAFFHIWATFVTIQLLMNEFVEVAVPIALIGSVFAAYHGPNRYKLGAIGCKIWHHQKMEDLQSFARPVLEMTLIDFLSTILAGVLLWHFSRKKHNERKQQNNKELLDSLSSFGNGNNQCGKHYELNHMKILSFSFYVILLCLTITNIVL